MKARHFNTWSLFSILLLGTSQLSLAACDQTLSTGSNVGSVVSNAAAGSTICLNAGNYGNVTLDNIVKSNTVTLRSTSGNTASINLDVGRSQRLTFQNLTITGMYIHNQAIHITLSNSTFTGQLLLNLGVNGGSSYGNADILIDGNSFDNISVCGSCYEGRLQVMSDNTPTGVTISNNHFGGPGESDGIQLGAYGVVVGPGNVFDGIVQNGYGRHVDALQGYGQSHTTITGNYFLNGDTYLMMPDGGNTEQITNNVFYSRNGNNGIQLGTHVNDTFIHNTVVNVMVNMDKKVENTTPSQNTVARNNIMIGTHFKTVDSNNNPACSNCTFDHNLFNSSSNASGTNNIIGSPTFVGGTNPSTWPGYQLTTTSLGHKAASDGQDMGANYFGGGTPLPGPLLPPGNLRLQ